MPYANTSVRSWPGPKYDVAVCCLGVTKECLPQGIETDKRAGEDHGKGGKFLLLPPVTRATGPSGYIALRIKTYNAFAGLRVTTKGEDEGEVRSALAHLRQIRCTFTRAAAWRRLLIAQCHHG
jgi:hypothetical protein